MASQPPRPVVMDPLHITEFASDRYFSKLQQQQLLQQQQPTPSLSTQPPPSSLLLPPSQNQNVGASGPGSNVPDIAASAAASVRPPTLLPQSPFILPLRDTKLLRAAQTAEERETVPDQRHKKRRFRLGRLLHSKPYAHLGATGPEPILPLVSTAVPTDAWPVADGLARSKPKSLHTLNTLLLILPTELQIQIIAPMPLADILNLRLASKAWHRMVTLIESPIVRWHVQNNIPAYAKRLYPPDYTNLNFRYLCGIWHRLHVAAKLASYICEWVTKEIFLRTTELQRLEFAPQRERMRRRLIPLLFTIFHFFETYRTHHLQYIIDHDGKGLHHTPYTINPIEAKVMNMYDDRTLLEVHQVFPLVVASFCRRLRPPSYVGRVEKSLRGYLKDKPADEVHVATLCIGGLRQVERFWEIKGYNSRRSAVDIWYNSVAKDIFEPTAKARRGLMGLSRRMSAMAVHDDALSRSNIASLPATSGDGATTTPRTSSDNMTSERRKNFIFNTSLADGMPMGPMSRDQLRLLLPDLPTLQQVWLVTAEVLILQRKIVDKPSDIRRNAQVMLELIREDGIADEDEWWYGHGAHDSIRPPLDAIEEDVSDGDF